MNSQTSSPPRTPSCSKAPSLAPRGPRAMSSDDVGSAGPSNATPRVQQTSKSWKSASFVEQQRREYAQKGVRRRHSATEQLTQQQQLDLWRFQQAAIREAFPSSWLASIGLVPWQRLRDLGDREEKQRARRRAEEHQRWIEALKRRLSVDSNTFRYGQAFHLRFLVGVRGSVLAHGTIWRPRVKPTRSPHQVLWQQEEEIRPSPADDIAAWPSHAEFSHEGQERQDTRTVPNFGRRLPLVRDWTCQYSEAITPSSIAPTSKPWELIPALPPYDFDKLAHDSPPEHCDIYPFAICPIEYPGCLDCRRYRIGYGLLQEFWDCDNCGNYWLDSSVTDEYRYQAAVGQYMDDMSPQNMEHFLPWDLLQAIDHPESYPTRASLAEDTPFERYARQLADTSTYTGKGKGRMIATSEVNEQELECEEEHIRSDKDDAVHSSIDAAEMEEEPVAELGRQENYTHNNTTDGNEKEREDAGTRSGTPAPEGSKGKQRKI